MNDIIIRTEALSVGYDKTVIVDGIEFAVRAGQILTLVGPNGSGKSTLLKTLTKQLSILSGTVYLGEESMGKMKESEIAKKVSILMTERVRPELMTCMDIVSTGRYPYTGRLGILSENDWKAVEDAMKLVQVWDLKDRPFANISDGQSQRIMLARAICQEPELLIMDEPTSFLDISHKLELLSILKGLVKQKNLAVILSLHELDLTQKIADTVLCINHGKVEKSGPPEEIFKGDYIRDLYNIRNGDYLEEFGSIEFSYVEGEPEILVIGGGGKGIPVYRKLQKLGIPFAAGILHENDLDYPVARVLAQEVIATRGFEPISDEALEQGLEMVRKLKGTICVPESFGTMNKKNEYLRVMASQEGKLFSSVEEYMSQR